MLVPSAMLADTVPDILEAVRVTDLRGIEVTGKRGKYSRKNNPAYDLMRRIRDTKGLGDPSSLPYYTEDFYTKIVLGLYDEDGSRMSRREKMRFLKEYVDTAPHTGRPVLLVSLHEKAGQIEHTSELSKVRTIVTAERSEGVDEAFGTKNTSALLGDILANIDIYSDDITLMQQRFVSPIGKMADTFYRYSLNDTVIIDSKPHLELVFAPSSPEMFGFNGRLFVEADDPGHFIRSVEMRVPRVINLNYVDNIFITQEYRRDEQGKRHIATDDISLELTAIPGTPPLYARRLTTYTKPELNQEKSMGEEFDEIEEHIVLENPAEEPWDEWESMRLVPLSQAESGMGSLMIKMRKNPFIYWAEQVLKILVNGYVTTGKNSKVDLGPVNTLISYSSIEGARFRIGGLTTANLSDRWFGRGYVAYGTRDRSFKYNAEIEYSLTPKEYHAREFPVNSVKLHYQYDLDNIGQHYMYTNPDNVFLSLKRESSKLSLYRREAAATYELEMKNNLSVTATFRHRIYEATPWLPFVISDGRSERSYTLAGFMIDIRYAPGEKFMQTRGTRYPINYDAPVFRLTQEMVPKGMLGSRFNLSKTEISVSKRVWLSAFGYMDVLIKGGKIWSTVDYPALMWPNANLSFTIQPESYSLMNPMEFALDYYGSIDFSYFANGLIFNQIPFLKLLKLREVFTFKGLMGGLTRKNNPSYNKSLFTFPEDADVQVLHGATPYVEAGVGIDNILTCLRLDYIWRLTYRHLPHAPRGGLRVSLHFSF